VLTDEQFIDELRSALRTDRRDPPPDLLERIHADLALDEPGSRRHQHVPAPDRAENARSRLALGIQGQHRRMTVGGIVSAFSAIVAIVIAVGALALLGHDRQRSSNTTGARSERQLVGEYAVLRRPQTAADRNDAGPLDLPARTYAFVQGHQALRLEYTDIPSLTRVVRQDGVEVSLFVVHITLSRALSAKVHPATVPGVVQIGAPGRAQISNRLRGLEGYSLWARVAGAPDRHPRLVSSTASFTILPAVPAPADSIIAVVPDNVARVDWTWPRQFNTTTLKYDPPLAIRAAAHNNVAIASAARDLPPAAATWEAADGRLLARIRSSEPASDQYSGRVVAKPAPETALSRRAERDPSTPNRVVIAPDVGSLSTTFNVFFRALLTGRDYLQRITGGPHPGCVKPIPPHEFGKAGQYGTELYGDSRSISYTVRGETFSSLVQNAVSCPGTYRLSISVLNDRDQPYPRFGSATFMVH
jgi:hypothetical protein